MILSSFFFALGQIGDARFRRVLFFGLALAIALLIGAVSGLTWLIGSLTADTVSVPWLGEITWLDNVITWSSFFLFFGLSIFLMMPVASLIVSFLLDEVAAAVEERYFPQLAPAKELSFGDTLIDAVNFLGLLIAANILALIIYAMFPPMAVFIFWGMNGFLLGREYFILVATRHVGRVAAKEQWRAHSGTVWMAGTLMAIPLSIPLINLLIPIIGAATFTHLYHRLTEAQAPDQTNSYR